MTPAEALAVQGQRPRLPPNWGASLLGGVVVAPRPAVMSSDAANADSPALTLAERTLRLLRRMAIAGIPLPASNLALCQMLDHTLSNPRESMKYALKALDNRGAILCGYEADGRRYIVVTDTGHRVEEARR